MNILYLSHTGDIIGGGEISLLNLLENLDRNKFQPYVIAPFDGNFTKKIRELNIPVILVPVKKIKNPLNVHSSIKSIKHIMRIIKKYQIDLIHANVTGGISFLGGIAARIAGIPLVWHVRVIFSAYLGDLIQSILSTKIIVISEGVRKRFWWIPQKNKFVLIHNGVDLKKFNPSIDKMIFRNEIGCREDEFLIGTVGRYHPFKSYEYFVRVAKMVLKELPNSKFLIVGRDFYRDNKYLNYLRKLAKQLGVENKFIFMDKQGDIPRVFAALDVFILPTLEEPFGRVLIEAMACGKPTVAFRSGGVVDIVEDEATGFLVKPKDVIEMAGKISYLFENSDTASEYGRNGRMRAERVFSIKTHTEKIENIYRELVKT